MGGGPAVIRRVEKKGEEGIYHFGVLVSKLELRFGGWKLFGGMRRYR